MNTKLVAGLPALALLALACGCDAPELPTTPQASPQPVAVAPAPAPAPVATNVGPNGTEVPPMETPVTHTPRPFTANDPIEGRRSRAAGGYLGSTLHAKRFAEHQIMINQINEALVLYDASAGINGGTPRSHEEFMEKIIKPNGIKLPKLDDPVEYIFVPDDPGKGLQIRLKDSYQGDIWPPGATLPPPESEEPYVQPNQPEPQQPAAEDAAAQPQTEPAPRAIGVEGVGGAAGVAPLDLQQ